jgi:4-hydroxy-3-polyprenylbenzoate decarboxylase
MTHTTSRRMIVGITGATGIIFGIRALQILRELGIESHLVVSRAGEMTRAHIGIRSTMSAHRSPADRSAPWGC